MSKILFILTIFFFGVSSAGLLKKLAALPNEFHQHRIPNSKFHSLNSTSMLQELDLIKVNGTQHSGKMVFHVDVLNFNFFILTKDLSSLSVKVFNSNGIQTRMMLNKTSMIFGPGNSHPALQVRLINNTLGNYTLHLSLPVKNKVIVTWDNNNNLHLRTYLHSYLINKKTPINISAEIIHRGGMEYTYPKTSGVIDAVIKVSDPSGRNYYVQMNDKGLYPDEYSNDNIWTGQVIPNEPGIYIFSPLIVGTYGQGLLYHRNTAHLIHVSSNLIILQKKIHVFNLNKDIIGIDIYFDIVSLVHDTFRVNAEVYSYDRNGNLIPIVWLGGIYKIKRLNSCEGKVTLELHKNWTKRVNVCDGIILNGTYIADINTSFPIANYSWGQTNFIKFDDSVIDELCSEDENIEITKIMREGSVGELKNPKKRQVQLNVTGLVMIPGYCASVNPWLASADQFTDAYYFPGTNLNLGNVEYAERVLLFVSDTDLTSFGILAHSQGGMVALTIKNYYQTGLDLAEKSPNFEDTRFIQSVGTPWGGTPLAGFAAQVQEIFGSGCGSNSDLSIDGAVNWLSGITQESILAVFYYTTTSSITDTSDVCSEVTDIFMSSFNDGITELDHAMLPEYEFPRYLGNSIRECHTTDMDYPAQYLNNERNAVMNFSAAR